MRLAYIISAYQNPEQLIRLARRICCPDHWVFIHYDRRSPVEEWNRLESAFPHLPNIRLLERHSCRWGDFGHVQASLKGIAEIARLQFPCDYAILLTAQDYPLKSDTDIRRRLARAAGRSFMEASAWPVLNWENGRAIRRVENYHIHLPFPNWARTCGWPANGQHVSLPLKRKIPGGLHPWFGSSYWCLHRRCLEHICEQTRQHPEYEAFFRHALIPDECFFQTLLMNSPLADTIERRTLTYVDWRPPWPGILTANDLPKLRNCEHLFARKFNPAVDAAVLDQLDAESRISSVANPDAA